MKAILLFFVALVFALSGFPQNNYCHFYVGTYTSAGSEGIYLGVLNKETGDVEIKKSFAGIENPSFLAISPNKDFIYSVAEAGEKGSYVYALEIDSNKDLRILNRQSSNGQGPCYVEVSPDGKFVATATYGGGTTSLYPVDSKGFLEKASALNVNTGSSINSKRQKKPHAHSIRFSPYDSQVLSADLGTDHLDIYTLKNKILERAEQDFVKMISGSGPRHFEFHPENEVIYVINELNSTISVLKRKGILWEIVQSIATLPPGFDLQNSCADIHISKDGRYLYGSNRGHNSIAVYAVDRNLHTLEIVTTVSVEGNWPRNFGITPDGKWMLVANQKSNDISVFKLDTKTGVPEFTGVKVELPAPVCIAFL